VAVIVNQQLDVVFVARGMSGFRGTRSVRFGRAGGLGAGGGTDGADRRGDRPVAERVLSCMEAAEVLGMSERHVRRLRDRYEAEGAVTCPLELVNQPESPGC
jgi:hypothetical protein